MRQQQRVSLVLTPAHWRVLFMCDGTHYTRSRYADKLSFEDRRQRGALRSVTHQRVEVVRSAMADRWDRRPQSPCAEVRRAPNRSLEHQRTVSWLFPDDGQPGSSRRTASKDVSALSPSLGNNPVRVRNNSISGRAALLHYRVCPKSGRGPERVPWAANAETIVWNSLR